MAVQLLHQTALERTTRDVPEARVLVVARHPVGGIRTFLRYTYPPLAEAGYRFTFVVPDDGNLPVLKETMAFLEDAEYAPVPVSKGKCPLAREVRRQLRTGRFSIIHSQGFKAAGHAVWANLFYRLPHVVNVHEMITEERRRGVRGKLLCWSVGWGLRQVDRVIACGESVRENLLETIWPLRGRPECVQVIRNGIDVGHYAREDDAEPDLRTRLGLPRESTLLGFMGRFMAEKGYPLLIDALRMLRQDPSCPPFHLLAVGSGDFEKSYRGKLRAAGLTDVVSHMPFVADVQPILRQLDLLVVPSMSEAMPLLPMEAMVAGVPVLGSDCPGIREVLRGSPSRTFPVGDVTALCHSLRDALERPWVGEAREYAAVAAERFDVRPRAKELLAVVDRLTGRGKVQGRTISP
jgi:glycosyltransferase involved in cell wall biosynthesis